MSTALRATTCDMRVDLLKDLPILDFIPAVSPHFESPTHLRAFAEVWDRLGKEELRLVVHSPPRYGKTELILHGMAQKVLQDREFQFGYATYSADLASAKSLRALNLVKNLGGDLVTDKMSDWRFEEGGGVLARGVGGGWTGRGLDCLVIDDPIKERIEAESRTYRNRLVDWFNDSAYTRVEPGGSVIAIMARWHPKDLAGHLIDQGWQYLRLPAICDSENDPNGRKIGEPLWPERWSLERLRDRMTNQYTAASLYQGKPRPRGAAVFEDVHFYEELPTEGFLTAIGFDLAYSKKASADYSVIVIMRKVGNRFYVVDVIRKQCKVRLFRELLKIAQRKHRARARIYSGGGGEKGAVELIQDRGIVIDEVPATADKFVRAQPMADAWNAGLILLPTEAPWLDDFIEEYVSFTGIDDDHDDQVDAGVAAFDSFSGTPRLDDEAIREAMSKHVEPLFGDEDELTIDEGGEALWPEE